MAKFTKLPYSTSLSRAPLIFDLIHLDIWGSYRLSSRTNYRFFLTIVDDHSRMTWVHLLKQKSYAFSIIKMFANMAKTQFAKNIKTIYNDNALELDDKQCKLLFSNLGILHQKSYVDRPQQNSRVERKHRNILEMSYKA